MLCLSLFFWSIFTSKDVIFFWTVWRSLATNPTSRRALAISSSILSSSFFFAIRSLLKRSNSRISRSISLICFCSACFARSSSSSSSFTERSHRSTFAGKKSESSNNRQFFHVKTCKLTLGVTWSLKLQLVQHSVLLIFELETFFGSLLLGPMIPKIYITVSYKKTTTTTTTKINK